MAVMNEDDTYAVPVKSSCCARVNKKHIDSSYASERIVVKQDADSNDLEDGESLFLVNDSSEESQDSNPRSYQSFIRVVYILSILIILICLLANFIIN